MGVIRQIAKRGIMRAQQGLRLYPPHFGLVTGPPRSGTTAVIFWLRDQPQVSAHIETRKLIAFHRFIDEVNRFKVLQRRQKQYAHLARRMLYEHYARHQLLVGRRLIVEKEPLEPIALPDKRYGSFLQSVRILIPEAKFVFMVRGPVQTINSMSLREWGYSLTDDTLREFTLEEYIENWCACTDEMLQYVEDPNAYFCSFERLVGEPEEETRRLCDFLEIEQEKPFVPKETKEVSFSDREIALIEEKTQGHQAALRAHGLLEA